MNNAIVARVRSARRLLVITGAGVSAESGIPTFRDPRGWWQQFRPEDLATPEAFSRDPRTVWSWYDARRQGVAAATPNAGHLALAAAEAAGRRVAIVTQNVDDLHERAGSRDVVHVHGSLWQLQCTDEGRVFDDRRVPLPDLPPRCACGAIARPHIVWFGERLHEPPLARVASWLEDPWDAVLVVGTEATFGYIREWAVMAKHAGACLVEVNPRETSLTPYCDLRLAASSAEALPDLLPRPSRDAPPTHSTR
jgi:NAD-dependent deacetylase